MGNFNKFNIDEIDLNGKIYVVLFTSRNKDNKHLTNFVERRNAFVTTRSIDKLKPDFEAFVSKGVEGEMSRMYYSINARSNEKTQKQLIHTLIDNQYNVASLPQRIAAIASRKENSIEHKWLFDFDPVDGTDTDQLMRLFINDINHYHSTTQTKKGKSRPEIKINTYKTPNGYGIVVNQHFDTRKLLEKWANVELKRDDLLCVDWETKLTK